MPPLPAFPLFPDPERERVINPSKDPCGICGQARGFVYDGPRYGLSPATDGVTVCPWCIADGAAGKRGIVFNSTPQMNAADRDLVEHRTPGFVTWQGNHWLTCCGRACVYLGEADASDLRGRWASAVPSMFEGESRAQEEIDEIVGAISRGRSPCAFVFQCRVCRKLRAYWDCD